MTARGLIRNGTIVLAEPLGLPEGTEVELEVKHVVPSAKANRRTNLRELAEGIKYDFEALDSLREASKL